MVFMQVGHPVPALVVNPSAIRAIWDPSRDGADNRRIGECVKAIRAKADESKVRFDWLTGFVVVRTSRGDCDIGVEGTVILGGGCIGERGWSKGLELGSRSVE